MYFWNFIADCADNRDYVNQQTIADGYFSVFDENEGALADEYRKIFDSTKEGVEDQPVPVTADPNFTIVIDLKKPGIKTLIGLTLLATNLDAIEVTAYEDSENGTSASNEVSTLH